MSLETPSRIEPARLEEPTGPIADAIAELAASAATLGKALPPRTAGNLADLVRIMNTYYSNLIEGHNTPPDYADTPRQGDLDGRGNLSQKALQEFVLWFLRVCLDQVNFMSGLFELDSLSQRLRTYVESSPGLKPESAGLLEEALIRGEFERGEIARITGLPERSARRALNDVVQLGLLASDTPKGKVSLRFPASALEDLFPRLYPQT
jgi:Fic family protein